MFDCVYDLSNAKRRLNKLRLEHHAKINKAVEMRIDMNVLNWLKLRIKAPREIRLWHLLR